MSDLLALAERVEAATGPDRLLGAEVEVAFRGFPERAYWQRNGIRAKGSPPLDRIEFMASWLGSDPTSSLDAAMTLAGGMEGRGGAAALLREAMNRLAVNFGPRIHSFSADEYCEALARFMTAACLRARAAQPAGQEPRTEGQRR